MCLQVNVRLRIYDIGCYKPDDQVLAVSRTWLVFQIYATQVVPVPAEASTWNAEHGPLLECS